jgi:two-component system, response regulator YesN
MNKWKLFDGNEFIKKTVCNKTNYNNLKYDIIKFIDENFKDENLSVALIGDNFNMHPSYVSKLFKFYSGERLLNYIGKVRVDASKSILKNSKINIEEVAKAVGYSNVKTFTRTFSKFEGITPGRFREMGY